MRTGYALLAVSLLLAFAEAGSAQNDFDSALLGNIPDAQVPVPQGAPEDGPAGKAPSVAQLVTYGFYAESFPKYYDARGQNLEPYNIPEILRDIPEMWKSYGPLFKKVGTAMEMDPYALAAYCVFESYNEKTHTFNTRHLDDTAAGIASTQAQYVRGGKVPGLNVRLPRDEEMAKTVLRNNPEYGLRYLAAEFKAWYFGGKYFTSCYDENLYYKLFPGGFGGYHDLARSFPRVALPAWTDPNSAPNRAYRTQAQYVSRAYALYKAFRAADTGQAR
jgi:hypothetical protein